MSTDLETGDGLDFDSLLADSVTKRGVPSEVALPKGRHVSQVEDFLSRGDAQLNGEQRGVIDKSDERDYQFYLAEAVKYGLISSPAAQAIAGWSLSRRNAAVSYLQSFITQEDRNYRILKEGLKLGTIGGEEFKLVAGYHFIDERTQACNRIDGWNRAKNGDDFAKTQHTIAAVAHQIRGVVRQHPLSDGHGGVGF